MDFHNLLESLFRWVHVVAGITWIGLLYFFNWVNSAFAPTMDGETKKKVVPELLPRALYWFRWGAAYTWITGVLLLVLVYYHTNLLFADPANPTWGPALLMLVIVFPGVYIYDVLVKTVMKTPPAAFIGGLILVTLVVVLFQNVGGFGYRGTAIHLGALFGTIMAFNVWYRIWPAQQKIIRATKNGEAADASLVALAGTRSKHNTYMSVPLVFAMLNLHTTWIASNIVVTLPLVVLVGWLLTLALYGKAKKVQGF